LYAGPQVVAETRQYPVPDFSRLLASDGVHQEVGHWEGKEKEKE
jgi:hypothetical protein